MVAVNNVGVRMRFPYENCASVQIHGTVGTDGLVVSFTATFGQHPHRAVGIGQWTLKIGASVSPVVETKIRAACREALTEWCRTTLITEELL